MNLAERKRRWEQLVLRLRDEASRTLKNNTQKGVVIVTAHILMDSNGTPLVWVVPDGKRVEPTKDAQSILEQMSEGF